MKINKKTVPDFLCIFVLWNILLSFANVFMFPFIILHLNRSHLNQRPAWEMVVIINRNKSFDKQQLGAGAK